MNDAKYIGLDVHQATISVAATGGVASEDLGRRCPSSCRTVLPAVRLPSDVASRRATGTASGGPEASAHEIAAADSHDRSIRAVLLLALMQTPNRFRTKRQLWAYCGLALRTYTSGEYRIVGGQLKRSKKFLAIRGLNLNHNHALKNIFKGAATRAASTAGPFQDFYQVCLARGMKPHLARLTLARKIAAITLLVWKKGVRFDAEHLKQQAA